jgi:DNA polymerase-3 subunit gamma/tau
VLSRAWQMLLKGLAEVQQASQPLAAAEMVLIRLTHAAQMPTPGDLVKHLMENGAAGGGSGSGPAMGQGGARPQGAPVSSAASSSGGAQVAASAAMAAPRVFVNPSPVTAVQPQSAISPELPQPQSFDAVVALFAERREAILHTHLQTDMHLVRFDAGFIEFRPGSQAPRDLAARLGAKLLEWTGKRWMITVSGDQGAATLREQATARVVAAKDEASRHPLVKAVLQAFPGAQIDEVRDLTGGLGLDKAAPLPGLGNKAASAVDRDADASQDEESDMPMDEVDLDGFSGMDGLGDDES